MHPNRKLSILLFFLTVVPFISYGMNGQDTLIMKNGVLISSIIQDVNPWAFTLQDDSIVAIRNLSEIKTSNLSIIQRLKSYYPNLEVSETDSIYRISVGKLILLPSNGSSSMDIVQRYVCLLNIMSSRAENIEIQVNMILKIYPRVIAQLTVSPWINFSSSPYNLHQVSLGIGYIYPLGDASLCALLNVGQKYLHVNKEYTTESAVDHFVSFMSIYGHIPVFNHHYIVSLGTRYCFSNIPIEGELTTFSVNIGFGVNINYSND